MRADLRVVVKHVRKRCIKTSHSINRLRSCVSGIQFIFMVLMDKFKKIDFIIIIFLIFLTFSIIFLIPLVLKKMLKMFCCFLLSIYDVGFKFSKLRFYNYYMFYGFLKSKNHVLIDISESLLSTQFKNKLQQENELLFSEFAL